ncbi:class I SAM-dependent methyltransferase [Bacillus testis]|uniref:class I SAM-dependent methyltransferase n=1 Tax=Bacillus testis TaxID=1622072 RepID=UPI00067EE62A|nr:SAM-dependent methyltransferase [Bacillus testis]
MENYIKNEILKNPENRITYAHFIEMALYHPIYGYYMQNRAKIGKGEDFYTNSNMGSVFGDVLGNWFCRLFRDNDLHPAIYECGAGTGKMANDLLNRLKMVDLDLYNSLTYFIIEKSPYHQKIQSQLTAGHPQVKILATLPESGWEGILWSNEYFDAFPVHVIEKQNQQLFEIMVMLEGDQLKETRQLATDKEIYRYLRDYNIVLGEGQRIEIPLAMEKEARRIYGRCNRGLVLSIDYGYRNEEWGRPAAYRGSLRGYKRHIMLDDVLQQPGSIDITCHVQWDTLFSLGRTAGMDNHPLMNQQEFLLASGILELLEEQASVSNYNPFSPAHKYNRSIAACLNPAGISNYFQVALQTKGLSTGWPLFEQSIFNSF